MLVGGERRGSGNGILSEAIQPIVSIIYHVGALITFFYLTFLDGYSYTWWNWLIAVPVNAILGAMWPIYWGVLRWLS